MKKIYLLFICFSCLILAQNDDPKNNTLYQKDGKNFEVVGSNDSLYRVNITFNDSTKEFTLKREATENIKETKSPPITKLDYDLLSYNLKKLFPGIDDKALNKLIIEMDNSNQNYEHNKKIKELTRQLDLEKRNIGKIGFRKKPKELSVKVYIDSLDSAQNYICNIKVGTLEVENAQIAFGDGVISQINVNGTFKKNDKQERRITFYNYSTPIPISTSADIDYLNGCDFEYRYWLVASYNDNKAYFIYLSDVLYYEQNLIYNYGIYIPPDGKVINLNDSVVVFDLRKESFINDFDLRIYTDLTGLSADNPNGLIKFMGNYKLNFTGENLFKPESPSGNECGQLILSDYTNLYFNFNKIESDELVLPVKSGDDFIYTTTFDLYRYSKFELGIDWNIINWKRQYSSNSLNFLLGVYHTPVDSVFTIDNESFTISDGVNSFYAGLKFNYKFLANEYVDVNLGYSFIIPQLFSDNKLKEVYGPIDDPNSENNIRNGSFFNYFKFKFWIHRINAELSIFPDPQDKSSYIFLKSILNFSSSDNYISLLLGYTVPFSNIIAIGQAP